MSQFLKQSTAAAIMFGPFVDKTDGVTLETGAGIITSIDHATTGIFLSKNGAAAAIRHQNVTASVLDAYGMFKVTLDTTDTGTVGTLDVLMAEAATFLPVHKTFMVLPANVYDALMGTDLLDVNTTKISETTQTGNDVGADVNEILIDTAVIGALGAGLTAITDKTANLPTDPADQSLVESAITAAHATTDGLVTAVDNFVDTEVTAIKAKTDQLTFTVVNKVDATATVDTSAVAGAVWDEVMTSHVTAGSFGDLQCMLGKWEITGNQLKLYDTAGTLKKTYNLTQDGVATEWNPDARSLV